MKKYTFRLAGTVVGIEDVSLSEVKSRKSAAETLVDTYTLTVHIESNDINEAWEALEDYLDEMHNI